jgi:protein-S-isoprenylcysteine O-methyltransferase Ste14
MKPSPLLKILPPIWFFFFLGIALLVHFYFLETRLDFLPSVIRKIIGALLVVWGLSLSLGASKRFKEENTEILPASPTNRVFIIDGPYKKTRNPMYLGMVLLMLGIGVLFDSPAVLVAALLQFTVLNFLFIPFEERKMENQFGEKYLAYKRSVRRWV